MAQQIKLDGQVAVITGAGAGIGRAIAETFAAAGAAVMVSDRDIKAASAVAKRIEARGGKAVAIACDVTKREDLARLVHDAARRFGKLTALVSNAGGRSMLAITSMAGENKNKRMASCGSSKAATNHPRFGSWTRPSGLRCGAQARRDDAAGCCPQGGATPHACRSAARSGA